MKRLVLCADDFGLNEPVNRGIVDLVRAGRLNAVSCMAVGSQFAQGADELFRAVRSSPIDVQIGLHLTFTEYEPLLSMDRLAPDGAFPSIGTLILKSHTGRVGRDEITLEIERQIDRFEEIFGRKPDFLDGHQHVHVLPTFRDAVVEVAKARLAERGWVRSCYQPLASILKTGVSIGRASLISGLSGSIRRLLKKDRIETNGLFLGVNDFQTRQDFRVQMRKWLGTASHFDGFTVIMCHPGHDAEDTSTVADPIASQRPHEFAYLSSARFLSDLKEVGLSLSDG